MDRETEGTGKETRGRAAVDSEAKQGILELVSEEITAGVELQLKETQGWAAEAVVSEAKQGSLDAVSEETTASVELRPSAGESRRGGEAGGLRDPSREEQESEKGSEIELVGEEDSKEMTGGEGKGMISREEEGEREAGGEAERAA